MKETCSHCNHVFDISFGADDQQGFFITPAQLEALEVDVLEADLDAGSVFMSHAWAARHLQPAIKCPKCKQVSVYVPCEEKGCNRPQVVVVNGRRLCAYHARLETEKEQQDDQEVC